MQEEWKKKRKKEKKEVMGQQESHGMDKKIKDQEKDL